VQFPRDESTGRIPRASWAAGFSMGYCVELDVGWCYSRDAVTRTRLLFSFFLWPCIDVSVPCRIAAGSPAPGWCWRGVKHVRWLVAHNVVLQPDRREGRREIVE